jgi:hypothetical protein
MKLALSVALLLVVVGAAMADVSVDRRVPRAPVNLASQPSIAPVVPLWSALVAGFGRLAGWPPYGLFGLKYPQHSQRGQFCSVLKCLPVPVPNNGLPLQGMAR